MAEYDGIIIGAGPNGMTVGSYLAKAGFKILMLERRNEIGGGLATEMITIPGLLHDTHAIFHMMVEYAPPLKDLEFEKKYGLQWIYPDLQVVMPFSDGSFIALYVDPEKSYESIKKFSQKDAEAFKEFAHWSQEATDLFLAPATYVNPLPPLEQVAKLVTNPITKRADEITGLTPRQIVDETFENDRVRALFLYLACMWGIDYDLEGLGYLVPLFINRGWHFRLCHKGSHHVTHVFGKSILENGGRILTGQILKRIVIEDGQAMGVELDDGTVIKANKFVVSSLNPHQTFFDLVGEQNLDSYLAKRINNWKYSGWSFFTLNLALRERPRFRVAESNPELDNALLYVVGYEGEQDLINHLDAIKEGKLMDGGFKCCFPTVHDPVRSMSPALPNGHVGLISQRAPYELENGSAEAWYKVREEHAERCLSVMRRYAPNMNNEIIMSDYISTPLDIENKFPDMKQGCFKQGAYLPLQMGYYRPNEICSEHTTPIKRLYLCGSSTHSGGMITYGPGYCAVQQIAEDLNIEKWWEEHGVVLRARDSGLL